MRWLIIFIIIVTYLVMRNVNNLYDYAEYRSEYAKYSDLLNTCIQFSNKSDFLTNQNRCKSFLKKNSACENFPERNPECISFLGQPTYQVDRNFCYNFSSNTKKCKELVHDNLSYAPIMDMMESSFILGLSKIIDYPINTLLGNISFNGIKIDEPWYKHISQFSGDIRNIYIATIAPEKVELDFFQGIELAAEQLNKNGGVFGRQIQLVRRIDDGSFDWNRNTVNTLIQDKKVIAVINRQTSEITKPLTMLFEDGGLLNLIVSAGNVNIILAKMQYNFRIHPNNADLSRESARYCFNMQHKKLAMLTELDAYSQEVGRGFYSAAQDLGMRMVYVKTVSKKQTDFTSIINDIKKKDVDAIFLSSLRDVSANFIFQSRRFGITIPFYGSKTLENKDFILQAGVAAEGLVIPSIYNEMLQNKENIDFISSYQAKYGKLPTTWTVQGYDALNLIVTAIKYANSTNPIKIASIMRYNDKWTGAGGIFHFNENGEIKDRQIFFKKFHDGEFRTISNNSSPIDK
ncbi:branched-chain amino acid transport system substrate-binding protein [Gammaproteobacteria bacterium]